MKKNKLRDQDKDKINKINQDQIMNLLIVRMINYKFKEKKIMSFNFNFSSNLSAQTQLKILATQKKNSSWYLDSSVSFHVFSEKDKFTNLKKVTESSATISTETDLNTDSIETLRIQVNDQILTLHDFHYSSNTVTNLIFFEMLE